MGNIQLHQNNPDVNFTVSKNLELKEDEVVLALGMVCGNKLPDKAAWTTIQFSTKNLNGDAFTDDIRDLICQLAHRTAVHHGWIFNDHPCYEKKD